MRPFALIETMLYVPGSGYWLLARHGQRLAASAAHLGLPFAAADLERAAEGAVQDREGERLWVRLLFGADGQVSSAVNPLSEDIERPLRYTVSEAPTQSADPWLYHKTTRRERYDRDWRHCTETLGADEVIYLNERGELTEGSRTTLFIARNGLLETPPLSSGLLPGTLRAELLARGQAVERRLTREDLERGDAVYLGNSVRGLRGAESLILA